MQFITIIESERVNKTSALPHDGDGGGKEIAQRDAITYFESFFFLFCLPFIFMFYECEHKQNHFMKEKYCFAEKTNIIGRDLFIYIYTHTTHTSCKGMCSVLCASK